MLKIVSSILMSTGNHTIVISNISLCRNQGLNLLKILSNQKNWMPNKRSFKKCVRSLGGGGMLFQIERKRTGRKNELIMNKGEGISMAKANKHEHGRGLKNHQFLAYVLFE